MARHVVVGAGGIGRSAAAHLAGLGHEVDLASRRGTDPGLPGVRAVALDASDAEALTALLRGAASLVNAVSPSHYYSWAREWPPVAAAMLAGAERTGAGLVTVSNLYGYGPVDGPLTEDLPQVATGAKGALRARMWADALAAHRAGRLRATELRASDYFGPGASTGVSMLTQFVIAPAVTGRRVRLVSGAPDVPHSWTYLDDIGALAATLATDDRSWGRPWHVPTAAPLTPAQVAAQAAALVGRPAPTVTRLPGLVLALGHVSRTVRELDETTYQFERPFVLDSTAAQRTFGLTPTPWEDALATTVAALAGR